MSVTNALSNGKQHFSYEITPPDRGRSYDTIAETVKKLRRFEPAFIDITYHQEETHRVRSNGGYVDKPVRKKPGTIVLAARLRGELERYETEVVPHIICGGFTVDQTEDALLECYHAGMSNVLAIRGDPPKGQEQFVPKKDGHRYASGLVTQIKAMNNGKYLDEDLEGDETNFCIGIAGYPEKHPEAPDIETDIKNLKVKVDAGADYMVTQMCLDLGIYQRFVAQCRKADITVPIVPGIKVLTRKVHLTSLPRTFGCSIPQELLRDAQRLPDDSHIRALGIEYAIAQSRELRKLGASDLHFYVLNDPDAVVDVMRRV